MSDASLMELNHSKSWVDAVEAGFAADCPPTVGVELELGIVDRRTRAPRGLFEYIESHLPPGIQQRVRPEFLKCQVEYASHPHHDLEMMERELTSFLRLAERLVTKKRAELLWSANFPFWEFDPTLVTDCPRSAANLLRLGQRCSQLATNSLHIHVAVPRGNAIQVLDGMSRFIPLLVALTANSPIENGRLSGSVSRRAEIWSSGFPVSGLMEPCRDWAGYRRKASMLIANGRIQSAKDVYYWLRPTAYGTIEIRCCDLPSNLQQVMAITALCQTLVTSLIRNPLEGGAVDLDIIRADLHDAFSRGIHARLNTEEGRVLGPLDWYDELTERIAPIARELGTTDWLVRGRYALARNGAEDQLHAWHVARRHAGGTGWRDRFQFPRPIWNALAGMAGLGVGIWL